MMNFRRRRRILKEITKEGNSIEMSICTECSSASLKPLQRNHKARTNNSPQKRKTLEAETAGGTRADLRVVRHVRTDREDRETQILSDAVFQWIKLNQQGKKINWSINIKHKMRTTLSKIRKCL